MTWLAIVATALGGVGTTVFFSLWMVARQRIDTIIHILEDERARKRIGRLRSSDPSNLLEIQRRNDDIDQIRERWAGWSDVDDKDPGDL